jgi:hypothetical protein
MSTEHSLEESIRTERELIAAIRASSRRLSIPILMVIVKTFAVPFLAFIALLIMGGYFRAFMNNQFQDVGVNSTAQFAAALLTVAGTVIAWRWAERRFGGLTLVRRLATVSRAVLRVEQAIESARSQSTPAADDLARIDALANEAWDTYLHTMRASGLPVDEPL